MKRRTELFLILLLIMPITVASAEQLKVLAINYIDNNQVYIITEKGGDNFYFRNVKISFDDSVIWPMGEFVVENGRIWRTNNFCTLIFREPKQANEWLKYQDGILIKNNNNSTISASYSKSQTKGCFISSLTD